MTDISVAEKSALLETWPVLGQLLCNFHVRHAEKGWLTSAQIEVHKYLRTVLMSALQQGTHFFILSP